MRKSFKQTEIGIIPEDWNVDLLNNISLKITDGEHATPIREKAGFFLLSARNILNGRIDLTDVDYVGFDEYQRIKQRCNPESGDLLISCSGTIGRVSVLPVGIECVMVRSAALVKYDRTKANGLFLQYYLQSAGGQSQIFYSLNQGAQANLFLNHIEKLKIPIPPLTEQKVIAAALSDIDTLIISLEKFIEKKRNIKQSTMQELLTGKTRLPGFTGEWLKSKLENHIDLLTGYPFKSSLYSESGIKLLRCSNIKRGETDWSQDITVYWPRITSDLQKYILEEGDIVIAMDGSLVGKSFAQITMKDLPSLLLQRVARIRSSSIDMGFLKEWICSKYFSNHCDLVKTVTAIPHISPADIKNFIITFPTNKKEQIDIASILIDMDAEIETLDKKLNKYRGIKQGMMQELLTGKIRLVDK